MVIVDCFSADGACCKGCMRVINYFSDLKILLRLPAAAVKKAVDVFYCGVSGVIDNNHTEAELKSAVKKIYKGEKYLSPSMAFGFIGDLMKRNFFPGPAAITDPRVKKISNAEKAVLKLICSGKKAAETAQILGISKRTAESQKESIMKKLGINRTALLIVFAVENGLNV